MAGGDDPFNREAQWLYGFTETVSRQQVITDNQDMFKVFQAANEARRQAVTANEGFLTSTVRGLTSIVDRR